LYYDFEAKVREYGVKKIRVYESFPNYFMPGVDPFYTEAVCFFERTGFNKFSECTNLLAELYKINLDTEAAENELSEVGFSFRRAEKRDFDRIRKWVGEHFKIWISEVNIAFTHNPVSLHISEKEGEIIAFSAYETNNFGEGWFGPMGTTETARGKGIGGILLKRCLNDLKEHGFQKAIIPWVGPIPFYMHYVHSKVHRIFWRFEKIVE
jgi:N-acetylglutamate synthase-like GNAT family acetyltransferase